MQHNYFTSAFTVQRTPAEVFDAICNVHGWWTGEIEGEALEVGDEFSYRYPGFHFSVQKVTELIPGKKVVWHVVDARLEGFEHAGEWSGTDIIFDIATKAEGTEVEFAHRGLVPEFECFDSCASAWGFFVNNSLQRFVTTGEGPTAPPWA